MYMFAVYLMEQVATYLKTAGDDKSATKAALQEKFGNLALSMYSLFAAVTGGFDWNEMVDSLSEIHWSNGLIAILYVFVTVCAIMNIITGLFVEQAVDNARSDQEEVV